MVALTCTPSSREVGLGESRAQSQELDNDGVGIPAPFEKLSMTACVCNHNIKGAETSVPRARLCYNAHQAEDLLSL